MTRDTFAYVWSYRVPGENADPFVRLYGPDGEWVELFRQGEGYLETRLYRSADDAERYLAVDRWESESAFRRFREKFAEEYGRLDRLGEGLTSEEKPLGEFFQIGGPTVG